MNVEDCKEFIHSLDESLSDENEETFKASVLFWYGTINQIRNTAMLCLKTGYDRNFIHRLKKNLTKNKIWVGYKTHADLENEETSFIEFWLCVSCAMGDIIRIEAPEEIIETIERVEPENIMTEIEKRETERKSQPYEFYKDKDV